MNVDKHTATIPIEDYTELLTFKDKAVKGDESMKKHMMILYESTKILALPDLSKTPLKAKIEYDAKKDVQVCRFEY